MGKVYAITDGTHVKIGHTGSELHERINQLQVGNPRKLRIIWSKEFKCDNVSKQVEKTLHLYAKKDQVSGEWFKLSMQLCINLIVTESLDANLKYPAINKMFFAGVKHV